MFLICCGCWVLKVGVLKLVLNVFLVEVLNGDVVGVFLKVGVVFVLKVGVFCLNIELFLNVGVDVLNVGVDVDVLKVGVDEVLKVGVVDVLNVGVDVVLKVGVDVVLNVGVDVLNSGVVVFLNVGVDWVLKVGVVDLNGWLLKVGCDCLKDGDLNGFGWVWVVLNLLKGEVGFCWLKVFEE